MNGFKRLDYAYLLVIVTLLLVLPHLSLLPPNIMEARNFITAREMAVDGNWIMTTLNGMPRYEKPPLPTWLTAFSGLFFGFNSLTAMRFPVTLVTLLLVWSVYLLTQQIGLSKRQSFHNALILVTSFYIFFAGRDNQWDMYCHSFMMLGIFFIWRLINGTGNKYTQGAAAGVLIGCSILSKGPISLYTLLLPFFVAYAATYKFSLKKVTTNAIPVLIVIFIALLIGVSWSLYVRYMDPDAFNSITEREVSRWTDYNTKPFYYYWSFFTQSGIWTIPAFIALLYPFMKSKVSDLKAYQFTLAWTLLSLFLLSIVPEKKTRYLLPVLIPMALNTGFYIEYLWVNFKALVSKREKWIPIVGFGLPALIGVSFPIAQFFLVKQFRSELMIWLILSSLGLFIAGILIIIALLKFNFKKVFYTTIALQVVAILLAFPLVKSFLYNPNHKSPDQVRSIISKTNLPLYEFNNFCPEIVWAYGARIPAFKETDTLRMPLGILVEQRDSVLFMERFSDYTIQKKGYIDMSISAKGSNSGKSRLYRDFYFVAPN